MTGLLMKPLDFLVQNFATLLKENRRSDAQQALGEISVC